MRTTILTSAALIFALAAAPAFAQGKSSTHGGGVSGTARTLQDMEPGRGRGELVSGVARSQNEVRGGGVSDTARGLRDMEPGRGRGELVSGAARGQNSRR